MSERVSSVVSRRTLAAGVAWTTPVVMVASAAPAFAASGSCATPVQLSASVTLTNSPNPNVCMAPALEQTTAVFTNTGASVIPAGVVFTVGMRGGIFGMLPPDSPQAHGFAFPTNVVSTKCTVGSITSTGPTYGAPDPFGSDWPFTMYYAATTTADLNPGETASFTWTGGVGECTPPYVFNMWAGGYAPNAVATTRTETVQGDCSVLVISYILSFHPGA